MSRAAAEKLTALEHLHELWLRLAGSILVMFVGGGFAYVVRLQIIRFLQRPLGEKLYYTSPTGSFQFVMQVCLLCGFVLALPIAIYNILRFIEPVFSKGFSRKFIVLVLGSSLVLTAAGVAFGYYLTLPFALRFFSSVGTATLLPLISVNEYFSFILGYLATFAIVFQLPLLLLFINNITPFKPGGLTKWRRYVYIGAFAISLIMPSSPDPLSQVSLAIPIIVLYEVSVVLIWGVNRKKHRTASMALQPKTIPDAALSMLQTLGSSEGEPFSIARLQENMRKREKQEMQKVSKEVDAILQPLQAIHKSYQRPVRRRLYTYTAPTRAPAATPRTINVEMSGDA